MKIFLTGGTGFIGSNFLNSAHRSGYEVIALRMKGSVPRVKLEKEPIWVEGRLDENFSKIMIGCDVLVHFAAHSANPPYDSIEKCLYWNLTATLQLFNQAENSGIKKFIIAGSCFEYGLSGEDYEFIPTSAPLKPTNSYAASKAALSTALYSWTLDKKVEVQILRIFQVFGDGELDNRLWPSLKRSALKGENYSMTKGEQIRDFIHVDEVVKKFLNALKFKKTKKGFLRVINIGKGDPLTVVDFAKLWWNKWEAEGKLEVGVISYRENEIMRFVPEVDNK